MKKFAQYNISNAQLAQSDTHSTSLLKKQGFLSKRIWCNIYTAPGIGWILNDPQKQLKWHKHNCTSLTNDFENRYIWISDTIITHTKVMWDIIYHSSLKLMVIKKKQRVILLFLLEWDYWLYRWSLSVLACIWGLCHFKRQRQSPSGSLLRDWFCCRQNELKEKWNQKATKHRYIYLDRPELVSFSNQASGENAVAWKSCLNQIGHPCFLTTSLKTISEIHLHGKYKNTNVKGSWTGWWKQKSKQTITSTKLPSPEIMWRLYWSVLEMKPFVFYLTVSQWVTDHLRCDLV